MTAVVPCILFQRLHVRVDGHSCAVHAVVGMLRRVCLTYILACAMQPEPEWEVLQLEALKGADDSGWQPKLRART